MDMHSCYGGGAAKPQPSTMLVNRSLPHVENFECDTTGCLPGPHSVVTGHSTTGSHQQSPFSPNPQDIVECLYEDKDDMHRNHMSHHSTDHRLTPMPIRPPMSPCTSGPPKRYYCDGAVTPRAHKIREFTKEVVCLPYDNRDVIVIPRNEPRNRMAERGLIGNIRFFSNQSEEEIRFLITSVFRKTFNIPEGSLLKYSYLRTMPGTRRLMRAEILPDCKMDGNDIMSFCRQGSLYLLLDHSYEISLGPTENEDSTMDESVFENSYGHVGHSSSSNSSSSRTCSNDLEVLDKLLQPKDIKEEPRDPSCSGDELLSRCLHSKVVTSKCQLVLIRRGQVFEDTLWWLRRETWDVKKRLLVKFVGESNEDPEATKRTYMQSLVRHLATCRAFVGEPGHLLPSDDMTSLSEDLHYHAGRIVGIILTQGDIPINQFAETLIDYVAGTGGHLLQDVPNPVIRKKLVEICDTYNPSSVEDDVFKRIRSEMGFSKVLTPENKTDFVNMAIRFYTTVKNHAQITRFVNGLEELGIVTITKQYPSAMKRLLCGSYGPNLEPGTVYDQFDCHFTAPPGDHCRDLEEVTAIQFFMFLTECSQKRGLCSLEDFIRFLTGKRTFPPGGFARKVVLTFSGETKCPILMQDPLKLTLPIGLSDQQFSDVMRLSVFEKQEIKVSR